MIAPLAYGDPGRMSGLALGVTLAEVSDIDDPKGMGRIKVAFLVDGAAAGAKSESDWVPMMSLFGGDAHGAFFLPKRGDSALVAFGNGDPSKPYVLGFLWNGVLKPPVEQAQQNTVRMIKTVMGKVIAFDDSDQGKLTITDERQNEITLDTANNRITIDSQGDLTITAKGTITLTAERVVFQNTAEEVAISLGENGITLNGADSIKLSAEMIDLN